MLLGMTWGLLLKILPGSQTTAVGRGVSFRPESFFYGLLPPIIYAAGFSLKQKAFFKNFGSILMFAVVGTIISTLVVGIATYMLYAIGFINPAVFKLPLLECLIYGSLISAIDPVATLSIFSDLNVKPLLYNLVFGESVLNDAVAIVLFRVLSALHGSVDFTFGTIPYVLLQFVYISLGSIIVGVATSCACALLLKVQQKTIR
jgi:NhaP-type Na+/H+ or K+/H+ antiporter